MDPHEGDTPRFAIDKICADSPRLRNQKEWTKARSDAMDQDGILSIFNLVPPVGKAGVAPAIYALLRGDIKTIDVLTRTPHDMIVGMVTSSFGQIPETDTLDKIDLLREKALELVRLHPMLLLSKN